MWCRWYNNSWRKKDGIFAVPICDVSLQLFHNEQIEHSRFQTAASTDRNTLCKGSAEELLEKNFKQTNLSVWDQVAMSCVSSVQSADWVMHYSAYSSFWISDRKALQIDFGVKCSLLCFLQIDCRLPAQASHKSNFIRYSESQWS